MLKITPEFVTETVAPTAEPVTRAEAKIYSRIDITTDDSLIDSLITAAREEAEYYTNRSFCRRTYRADIPYFADTMWLPLGPVISISSIKYYDTSSPTVLTSLATNTFQLVRDKVVRVHGGTWPSIYPRHDAVQITYVAGYAPTSSPEVEAENVPARVKAAIYLAVGDLYENRERQVLYPGQMQENKTFCRLLDSLRIYQ